MVHCVCLSPYDVPVSLAKRALAEESEREIQTMKYVLENILSIKTSTSSMLARYHVQEN